jgi:predicted outer membrane repeat protein
MKTILQGIILSSIIITFSLANIINVPADIDSIQGGIDMAINGDTVLVADGIYFENINYRGKSVTVTSFFIINGDTNHINNTVINGSQPSQPDSGSVIYFISGEDTNSVLCGFTITRGTGTIIDTSSWDDDPYGGGIFLSNSGAEIKECKIINNKAWSYNGKGGGIYCDSSIVLLQNTIISYDSANAGAGIASSNSELRLNNVTIKYSKCLGRDAAWPRTGGGILSINSNINLENVNINNNYGRQGGGIMAIGSIINLSNVNIKYNRSRSGGGIYCDSTQINLNSVTICNNTATIYRGGGIYCDSTQIYLSSVTVCNNISGDDGGGIYIGSNNQIVFDSIMRSNIYYNSAPAGNDLFNYGQDTIAVIVDTFTVLNPTNYHANPINTFTFDILNATITNISEKPNLAMFFL